MNIQHFALQLGNVLATGASCSLQHLRNTAQRAASSSMMLLQFQVQVMEKSVWFPFLFNLAYEKRDTKQNLLEIIAAHSRICFWWTKYQLQRGQRGPAVTTEKEWDICNALLTLSGSAWFMFYSNISGFNPESSIPPHTCSLLSICSQRGKTSLRSQHQHIQF